MLSNKTIETVKATIPVLQANGEALTRHFYKRMFEHNPEVAPLFNPANQHSGVQQQALASAICAYAENIDNLGVLANAVELIAQKHTSLQIKPEHYPVVGDNLINSIKEVLGDGATDNIINSWGEAYSFLADILIAREQEIYNTKETMTNGWSDFKSFSLTEKVIESENVTSFYLAPEDESKPPVFKPGQYITVRVPSPCGHSTMRNYSLSNAPDQDCFRISVKRESGTLDNPMNGYVSSFLHDNVEVGDVIELAAPSGDFFIDPDLTSDKPLVLISAGIGITPIMSMLQTMLKADPARKITFIHACINENQHTFIKAVDELNAEHSNLNVHYRYSKPDRPIKSKYISEGFIDSALIKNTANHVNADYYFCGPKPFMVNLYKDLKTLSVEESQINFEFFGPQEEIKQASLSATG